MDLVKTTKEERRELREKVALVMQDEGDPVGDWQKVLDVIDDLDEALVHAKAAEAELAGWKRDCHAAEDAEHSFGNAFITANAAAAQLHSAASAMLKAVELAHDCEDIHFGNRPEVRKAGGGVDCRIITDMRVALADTETKKCAEMVEALVLAEELTRDEAHDPNTYIPTCLWCGTRRAAPNDSEHFEHRPNCAWARLRSLISSSPNASVTSASDDARGAKSRSPEIEASANVKPAGGEDGAGVCSVCRGSRRCDGTGKEPAP